MLLPDKHIKISESILGLATLILEMLDQKMTLDHLMTKMSKNVVMDGWPTSHNTENVSLALCFLFSIGTVNISIEGDLYRCD